MKKIGIFVFEFYIKLFQKGEKPYCLRYANIVLWRIGVYFSRQKPSNLLDKPNQPIKI